MQTVSKGKLVLKDGAVYEGELYGKRNAVGEVVFTTGMVGYQEVITDPSFCDHIAVMTYPLIGNYGTNEMFNQSAKSYLQGFVVSELCDHPSNWRNEKALADVLEELDVPVLAGVDTRAITRRIRNHGVMQGVIVPAEVSTEEAMKMMEAEETNPVAKVTATEAYTAGEGKYHVAVIDLGVKKSVLNFLLDRDCKVTVFPATATAQEILEVQPDGIFISNGPGNPKALTGVVEEVKALLGKKPVWGVCLGHSVLALANGADVLKMKFGHRGASHPVKDVVANKIVITAQNHGYIVDENSLEGTGAEVSAVSLNDNTVEGLIYPEKQAFSVQFLTEAGFGSERYDYLMDRFVAMMGVR